MGFSIYYRSTRRVTAGQADAVRQAAWALDADHSWLSCEPVCFFKDLQEGRLLGASKPNFLPHPDDAASAARSGKPDGTVLTLIDILCQLSREHGVDFEVGHDESSGPIGRVRAGVCDPDVLAQLEAFAALGNILADEADGLDFDLS